jgi:hypothetical protein
MAVAALKAPTEGQQWALPAGTSPAWPLEGVMRLHSQLREGDVSGREMGPTDTALTEGPKPKALPEPAHVADNALVERIDSLERAVNDRKAELREYADAAEQTRQANQRWRLAVAALVVCLFGSVVVAWGLQRRADSAVARSADAERQSRTAADQANERIAKAQKEAALEISQARDAAVKAQTISTVLAAPDLVRYNLTGGDNAQRFSGQVLWSRSRGLVFSASRLPPAAPGTTYQVWLLTNAEPVSAGLVAPDESGRATIATDDPPRVPRPVTSIKVTVEPTAGSEQPTGPTVLTRAPVGEP